MAKDIWTIGGSANLSYTLAVRAVDTGTGVGTTYSTQTVTTHSQIAFLRTVVNSLTGDGTGCTDAECA